MTRALLTAARIFALAALAIQGSGATRLVISAVAATCCTPCDDDDTEEGEPCAPLCQTCTCAHASRPAAPIVTFQFAPAATPTAGIVFARIDAPVGSPDPRGIFHPPRV